MAFRRRTAPDEAPPEKPVYGPEGGANPLYLVMGMLWVLPQLFRIGEGWSSILAVGVAVVAVGGGVTTIVRSSTWHRTGLDSRLISLSGLDRASRALNAACGTGSLAVAFGKVVQTGEVVAVDGWKPTKRVPDPSKRTRDNVRIEGVDRVVKVQAADLRELPFKAGYFNVVGSRFGVSGARRDRRKVFAEMLRVTRIGGYVVLAESLPVALWLRYRVLPRLMADYRVGDVRLSRFHLTPIVSAQKLG